MARRPKLKPIRPIGFVRSRWGEEPDELYRIHIFDEYASGLRGLEQCSHALVVFQMHRAPFTAKRDLVCRPCFDQRRKEVGIFAQRCRHRPNHLGVSTVSIVRTEGDEIIVKGLDAWKGTPILDIKPYVPDWDMPPEAVRLPKRIEKMSASEGPPPTRRRPLRTAALGRA